MSVALLSIGTELTRGEIVNTNAAWLAAEITEHGFAIGETAMVPDDTDCVAQTLIRLASVHRLVVVTGGLGPTCDDITAAAAARAAKVEVVRDESALLAIRRKLEARGKTMNAGLEKQADVPAGSELLANSVGSAPGFALSIANATVFFLPGVPREMKKMFVDQVLPRVEKVAPNDAFEVRLRTYGIGESAIGEALEGVEQALPGVALRYRIQYPEVGVKIHARAATSSAARDLAARAVDEVKSRLGDVVYGEGDESFPEIVGRAVRGRGFRLAVAESCTGGLIAHLLTKHPASDFLMGAAVTYANSTKGKLLGVLEDTLRSHGGVSAEVAAEMAIGARSVCECEIGLAVTGIAGPSGGSSERPVGLCHWAVSHPNGTIVRSKVFKGDRDEVQLAAAYAALDALRRICLNLPVTMGGPRAPQTPQ